MENPDHRLTALMAAVYDTPEWQDFSHKLERLLNVRLLLIGGGKEEGPSVTGAVCYDLTVNDIAVGELVYGTDAAMPSRETIQSIGRIVQKGSALFGWFQSYFGIHPEAYLKTAPPSGDGLHCLYVKAPMSSSVPNKLCVLLQSQLHPVQHYRHRDSFSFLLQWDKQEKEEKLLLLREALRGAQLIAWLSGPFLIPLLRRDV